MYIMVLRAIHSLRHFFRLSVNRGSTLQTRFLGCKVLAVNRVHKFSTNRANVHTFVFRDVFPVPTFRGKFECIALSILVKLVPVRPDA